MKRLLIVFVLMMLLTGCSSSHDVVINYEPNGGTIASASHLITSQTINSNSPQWVPPTPQKIGFLFVNWYLDAALSELYTPAALSNKTLTFYAKYIEADQDDFFIVSFQSAGGTFIPNQLVPKNGLIVEPTIPIKSGYAFLNWQYVVTVSDKQGVVDFLDPVSEHMVLEAVYVVQAQDTRKQ